MESLHSLWRMHWDHEPTPNPSQEGNRKDADGCLLPSWEGSGVSRFMESVRGAEPRQRVRGSAAIHTARQASLFTYTIHESEYSIHQRRRRASTFTFRDISLSSRLISKVTSSPGFAWLTYSKKELESFISRPLALMTTSPIFRPALKAGPFSSTRSRRHPWGSSTARAPTQARGGGRSSPQLSPLANRSQVS